MSAIPDTHDTGAAGAAGAAGDTLERIRGEMEERRARNLVLLEHLMPEMHRRFRDYRPRRLALDLHPAHGPMLHGIRSGVSAYPDPPLAFAEAQVEAFVADPAVRTTRFRTREILQMEREAHTRRANRVIEMLQADDGAPVREFSGSVNTLFVFGLGLGYHLELLMERADVHHLCIVEPDPDVFHAALHTVEWAHLVEHFARPGYSMEVVLDRSPVEAGRQVATWLNQVGGHNAAHVFWYRHRGGEVMAETERFLDRDLLPHYTSFLGYYDDERTSLAHTAANAGRGTPLLRAGTDVLLAGGPHPPVFVVANGPSLDQAVDFLRENRDRGIVLSCGTALGSLVRAGIVPDLHLEMERTRPVREWIDQATTAEERERIQLVALNPVHPDVFQLFPRAAMVSRSMDLGAAWIDRRLPEGVTPLVVPAPGPTVGNCGLGLAVALGFTEIVLVGLDLGYPVGDQHHSRYSVHYRVKPDERDTLGVYRHDDPDNPLAPGNFGDRIRTTPVYLRAAREAENLLAQHPEVRVRNTSAGIRITGAEPAPLETLEPGESLDTRAFVRELVAGGTVGSAIPPLSGVERSTIRNRLARLAAEVRRILSHEVGSRQEAMLLLLMAHMQLHTDGAEPDSLEALLLLRGSVAYFSVLLARAVHASADEERALHLFREGLAVLDELLADIEERARGPALFDLDDKTRELRRKVTAA